MLDRSVVDGADRQLQLLELQIAEKEAARGHILEAAEMLNDHVPLEATSGFHQTIGKERRLLVEGRVAELVRPFQSLALAPTYQ